MTLAPALLTEPGTPDVGRVPLAFTGENGFDAAELRGTGVADRTDRRWADQVVAGLWPGERAFVSLAFEPGGRAVAHRVLPVHRTSAPTGVVPSARSRSTPVLPPARYADLVRAALRRIESGDLRKVVLGRGLDVVSEPPLSPDVVLDRLLVSRPGRHVFGMPTSTSTSGPYLLGASPELLVRRTGSMVASTPLAGSVPRSPDPDEDRMRAENLRTSAKDRAEHAHVVDAIVRTLESCCAEIDAPTTPQLSATDTLWHLATPIRARLAPGSRLSALHLAQLLHPTPAVGGVPTSEALETIDEFEGDLRGHLTGTVGHVDGVGDGEFAVTIRAGVLDGSRLRLFAGAGIVAGSDPDAEVRETEAKLATMARAIGVHA